MRHHKTAGGSVGPEPNERHLLDSARVHQAAQKFLVQGVYGEIYRPRGEWQLRPVTEINLLQVPANGHGKPAPQKIVRPANGFVDREKFRSGSDDFTVTFQTKVVHHFGKVE